MAAAAERQAAQRDRRPRKRRAPSRRAANAAGAQERRAAAFASAAVCVAREEHGRALRSTKDEAGLSVGDRRDRASNDTVGALRATRGDAPAITDGTDRTRTSEALR